MNKKLWVTLETIMLIVWVITTIAFIVHVRTSGTRCLINPLNYGANALNEQNDAYFDCLCKFDNEPSYEVYFSADEMIIRPTANFIETNNNSDYTIPNWSEAFDKYNLQGGVK